MGLKGKIFKFMSDILKDGSYDKLYTQAKSTSACGLPKGFFISFFVLTILPAEQATSQIILHQFLTIIIHITK